MRVRHDPDREILGNLLDRRIDMRIAYMNTDEVNEAVAAQMARKLGADVCGLHPTHSPPAGLYDAVLYNLDDVPRHRRRAVLAEILDSLSTCPRAVHGYDLSEDAASALRLRGVAVAQRLQLGLFRILCRSVLQGLTSVPPDDALLEETWICLAE
jgi:hypothetical protein